jgi:hypothetical protein
MELERPAQYYWTTLFDQYQPQSLSFAFLPSRSLSDRNIPQFDVIANILEGQRLGPQQIQPWHLPVLLAYLLRRSDSLQAASEISYQLTYGGPVSVDPQSLGFAEYAAYSDVIPFEESPLKGKSLMSIAAAAGVHVGMIAAGGHALVVLTVPLGILLCTAAAELGPELGKRLPKLMGLKR